MREAKKKRITIFNPLGTGMIAKQVRELLDVNHHAEVKMFEPTIIDVPKTEPVKEPRPNSKLHQLLPFVDWSKSNSANGKILMEKAKELGFKSTPASIANYIGNIRREKGLISITKPGLKPKKSIQVKPKYQGDDAVVEILDNIIKELTDIRQYFVAVTDENETLKARIAKFKKFLDE
jgi:hypothetical protein